MKKLLVVLFMFISINVYAFNSEPFHANIPGWIEAELNIGFYTDLWGNRKVEYMGYNILSKELKITYGGTFEHKGYMFEPYVFLGSTWFSTYKNDAPYSHNPFRDNYNAGFGVKFQKIFFVEFYHRCSHQVISGTHKKGNVMVNYQIYDYYENQPTIVYDMFRIGAKFKID